MPHEPTPDARALDRRSTPRGLIGAAGAVIAFGVVLRLLGFFDLELWADEAGWCDRLIDGNYGWIRPIGYMWVTKQLLTIDVNEQLLRSFSYLAGLAQLPLMFLALRRMVTKPWVAVFGTWLLAINPIAVAMTKEFKPYALESTLHTLLVVLALGYLAHRGGDGKGARWLAAIVVTALVAPLFAWTIIFAYPGVFTLLGVAALREHNRKHLAATIAGCVATLGVLLVLFAARLSAHKPDAGYWGKKYDVFAVGSQYGLVGRIGWYLAKTAEIAGFPAHLQLWLPQWGATSLVVVCVALCSAGIVALIARRQWVLATLLLLPWLMTLAFNIGGLWPYGLFRTNTFLLFYSLALVVVGIDAAAQLVVARLGGQAHAVARRAIAAIAVALAVVALPFELTAFQHKRGGTLTAEASVRKALERIYLSETGVAWDAPIDEATARERAVRAAAARAHMGQQTEQEVTLPANAGYEVPLLIMDGHACTIMRYYRDRNARSSPVFGDWLPSHFVTKCSAYGVDSWKALLSELPGRSFWLVAAKANLPKRTRKWLAPHCDPVVNEVLPSTTLLYHCRARAPAAGEQR